MNIGLSSPKSHYSTLHNGSIINACFNVFSTKNVPSASAAPREVTPDSSRCVQCGICSFNCPVEIDVRRHAWQGEPVIHSRCLTCGECVARCPRGVLAFERTNLFVEKEA
jgi:NAD-dependent dihydropyrimidine dehydrogenase PreA subunit